MGSIFTKKELKTSSPEQQISAQSFYVETTLKDVPKWAEHEWNYLLRQTEMASDQDNLDLATEKLNEDVKDFHEDQETFNEKMSNMEGKRLERTASLKLKQDLVLDEFSKVRQREYDVWKKEEENEERKTNLEVEEILLKRKAKQIQFRDDESKEREETIEKRRSSVENDLLKKFEKIQIQEQGLLVKAEAFEKMRDTKEKHLSEGLKSLEKAHIVMVQEHQQIRQREVELKAIEEEGEKLFKFKNT